MARELQAIQIVIRILLLLLYPPQAVLYQIGVEYICADIEAVVRLEEVVPGGVGLLEDRPGQEHPDRFAPDRPGSDHAAPDSQEVVEAEVLLGELEDASAVSSQHTKQLVDEGGDVLLRLFASLQLFANLLRSCKDAAPDAEALVGAPLSVPGRLGKDCRVLATSGHGEEPIVFPGVEHVHGAGMTSLHLARTDVESLGVAIDIDENLGGIGDRPGGVEGVNVPEEGEIGQAAMVQDVGADQHEEVAEHSIAGPIHGEIGQAVEEVVGARPGFFDHALEFAYQGLEPLSELNRVDLCSRGIGQQRRMLGEAEVDEAYAGFLGVITVGLHEGQVFLDGVDLPYDVVSRDHAAQDVVEIRKARTELWSVVRHDSFSRCGGGEWTISEDGGFRVRDSFSRIPG